MAKVNLDALLIPEKCVLLHIDHQPFHLANVHSHRPTMVLNNTEGWRYTTFVGDLS